MKSTASIKWHQETQKDLLKHNNHSTKKHNHSVELVFSTQSLPHSSPEENPNHEPLIAEEKRARSCITRIVDPLWKDVCLDILQMMGPVSALKIWESQLGEFSSQNKSFNMICQTEETVAFANQYNFVILGSLKRYFPGLKSLSVELMPVLSH